MEKRGVCLSVRIPPGGGEQVETGNLDAGTKGALNSDHRDYSNRVKESPENLLNRQDSPLNKVRKLGFSYLFPENRFEK